MLIENIADLHFGKTGKEEEMYLSLKNNFIKHCNEVNPDLIIINGDSYDSRQLINSPANIYFNKFINDCINTGATIIIFEGTESHDRHQINALSHYTSDKFFIINTVTKLNVCGLKFLIIPEEYVKDTSYYDEYFNDSYDFVQFHGMFSHIGYSNKGVVSDEIVRHQFILDAKMFAKNVKHLVIGGHIHTHSVYKNVIYCGSYSRLNFGEEESKGWIEVEVKGDKCKWKFIKNPDAPSFTTILASKLPQDTENLLLQLRGFQESNDFLRITLDVEDDNIINNIIGFVKTHENCCIKRVKSKEKQVEAVISDDIKEKQQKLNEQMKGFTGLSFIEITQKIAHDEYHTDMTHEEINEVLNTKV